MSSEFAIQVSNLSKCYQIYETPRDRLKQFIIPRVKRTLLRHSENYYREFWALKDVSFEIQKGETVGIVGRNGSGKSTLLQLICGTLNPTHGEVRTNGRIAALLELGSGFNPEFTGRENVYLNGALLGLSREEITSRYDRILAFSEIGDFINQPVKTYSSGMVVRLAFAVAINANPEILIVDEALSVGDELFQRKCFSQIEVLRASGATILFVSHSGGTVVDLCDRALLLDSGERLALGTPKQIIGRYQKLIYAPEHKRNSIRQEIAQEQLQAAACETETLTPAAIPELRKVIESTPPNEISDSFDPALKPSSTINYESHGAFIEEPAIYSLDNKRVNNLTRGKRYRYRYSVRFENTANNIKFGMLIKTTNGIELGGGTSAASLRNSLPSAEAGSKIEVEFEFSCMLNPGVYFLNAGVVGDLEGNETFLHRLIDAAMFRVLSESDNLATGTIDFACHSRIDFAKV
ncbi:ABC transporter ATP-binding protein [Pseudomonas sp.]|uniref:ABC transporter ATP-binding protein n=1 Tax=Pseudomonas sp. TaxID=306 RepID=UPI00290693CA|nr:ABC transporter ATP-binding protein [Pseudomonas sp.]MDU4249507.1 ABC transporter ATP-binding protein [Pseudomonas sp.]